MSVLNRTREQVANQRTRPDITLSYGAAEYTATEGGAAATVTVRLSAAPLRPIAIPLESSPAAGASTDDYDDVPFEVRFGAGDTARTFTVTAVDDGVDDDGETVELAFGDILPAGVGVGSPGAATVRLADNDTATGPPSVLAMGLTSDPGWAYAAGEEIEVTVRFDRTLTVTGTPRLGLTVGSVTRQAAYRGGSREVLRFGYAVAEGDVDSDGVSIAANSLTLEGGTIHDGAERAAALGHAALPDDAGHAVDGVAPTLLEALVNSEVLALTWSEAMAPPGGGRSGQALLDLRLRSGTGTRESLFSRLVTVQGPVMRVRLGFGDAARSGEEYTLSHSWPFPGLLGVFADPGSGGERGGALRRPRGDQRDRGVAPLRP